MNFENIKSDIKKNVTLYYKDLNSFIKKSPVQDIIEILERNEYKKVIFFRNSVLNEVKFAAMDYINEVINDPIRARRIIRDFEDSIDTTSIKNIKTINTEKIKIRTADTNSQAPPQIQYIRSPKKNIVSSKYAVPLSITVVGVVMESTPLIFVGLGTAIYMFLNQEKKQNIPPRRNIENRALTQPTVTQDDIYDAVKQCLAERETEVIRWLEQLLDELEQNLRQRFKKEGVTHG